MTRKIFAFTFTFALLFALAFSSVSFAETGPVPPSKGQWAFPLEEYSLLYSKADRGASNIEIEIPYEWIRVPSAVRDGNNYLWYSVNINGHKGWLPQNGIRLKLGGKSKSVSNLYSSYVKAKRSPERSFSNLLVGMTASELRSKLGTPTMRETPYDDINVSILSYELSDRDMTLSVTVVRDEYEYEGKVESVELYRGRTGSND